MLVCSCFVCACRCFFLWFAVLVLGLCDLVSLFVCVLCVVRRFVVVFRAVSFVGYSLYIFGVISCCLRLLLFFSCCVFCKCYLLCVVVALFRFAF